MRRIICLLLTVNFYAAFAQDSSASKKTISHELGFNTISLIKQLVSSSPSSAIPQLPYLVIYNLNLDNKNTLRAGVGFSQKNTSTSITGLAQPRTSSSMSADARLGYSRNILKTKRFVANAFADGVFEYSSLKSATTQTSEIGGFQQTYTVTTDSESSSQTFGFGGQVGFGLKFLINRNLFLYTECPLQLITEVTKENSYTATFGSPTPVPTTNDTQKTTSLSTNFFIPATVYLIFRF